MSPWREPADEPPPAGGWPSDRLPPGGRCRIGEDEWRRFLTLHEPLHQWGGAFLHDEGEGGHVRVYLRDDGPEARHTCVRLDAAASARARAGAVEVEAAARRAADLISAGQREASRSPADLQAEEDAGRAFVDAAETLYRALLAP